MIVEFLPRSLFDSIETRSESTEESASSFFFVERNCRGGLGGDVGGGGAEFR